MPRADGDSIVTFGGAWSDYCRYPLMWLGQPDPATALLEQVRHDPDGDALSRVDDRVAACIWIKRDDGAQGR
jgi:hypothetical protein